MMRIICITIAVAVTATFDTSSRHSQGPVMLANAQTGFLNEFFYDAKSNSKSFIQVVADNGGKSGKNFDAEVTFYALNKTRIGTDRQKVPMKYSSESRLGGKHIGSLKKVPTKDSIPGGLRLKVGTTTRYYCWGKDASTNTEVVGTNKCEYVVSKSSTISDKQNLHAALFNKAWDPSEFDWKTMTGSNSKRTDSKPNSGKINGYSVDQVFVNPVSASAASGGVWCYARVGMILTLVWIVVLSEK